MEKPKLIGQAIQSDILEKVSQNKKPTFAERVLSSPSLASRIAGKPRKGFGDQNSRIVNAEVFDNEDAILDDLDKLLGSTNFDEKSLKEFVDNLDKKK